MAAIISVAKVGAVAIITLEDREFHNSFSLRFITELTTAFTNIQQDTNIKVIIVHGYDSYFCCGGTKEVLLQLSADSITFNDWNFHDLFLRCEIPVIAAMQGHALGGGLTFACYADFLIFSEESIYSANFMKYGFTPGMGAHFIIPYKFGELLGREMLLNAGTYYGRVLKERGVAAQVVKRTEVLPLAQKIANELAEKPRLSLILTKQLLNKPIQTVLPAIISAEVAMHKLTFSQPEVVARLNLIT